MSDGSEPDDAVEPSFSGRGRPGEPGPTAESQMVHLAAAIGGMKGGHTWRVRVLVGLVLLAGVSVIAVVLVQALTAGS